MLVEWAKREKATDPILDLAEVEDPHTLFLTQGSYKPEKLREPPQPHEIQERYYLGGALPIEKPVFRKILELAGIKTVSTNTERAIFVEALG